MSDVTRQKAIIELWRRGCLSWKLYDDQKAIYDAIQSADDVKNLFNIHRRRGKSTVFFLDAVEWGLTHKNQIMHYIGPTFKEMKAILFPIFLLLCSDCPVDLKPVWKTTDGCYEFPSTGSRLYIVGTDKQNYEKARGSRTDRGYVDEAGFCDELDYIVNDIMIPQTITTGGKLFIFSTPPKTPAHDYYYLCMDAESRGNYLILDFDTCTHISNERKEYFIKEAGGRENTTCQREYYCKFVTEKEDMIVPEFTEEKAGQLVKEFPRPKYFDLYGAMDPGFKDHTPYILGYYDFINARYIIEAEEWLKGVPTPTIAEGIRNLEKKHFLDKKIYCRVSDTSLQLICDLSLLHKLSFVPTAKDDKEAQLNYLRMLVLQNKIYIHPRCVHLIRQLKTGIWNKQKTSFMRTAKEGHFDLIDALIYLVRNIDKNKNPLPALADGVKNDTHFISPDAHAQNGTNEKAIKDAFNI